MNTNEALKVANSQKIVSKQKETKYHFNGFHETTFTINTYLALNICTLYIPELGMPNTEESHI